jgi:hypothetical protein
MTTLAPNGAASLAKASQNPFDSQRRAHAGLIASQSAKCRDLNKCASTLLSEHWRHGPREIDCSLTVDAILTRN